MSEPIFEASVRLRAETTGFEQEAQASLKRTTDRLEASANQAIRTAQQTASRAALPGFAPNTTANDVLTQAITKARTLAAQPIEIDVLANTQPFERQSTKAYEQAIALAGRQAQVAKRAAITAAEEATAATQAVYTAGAGRAAAIAAARAKQAVSAGAQDALREAEAVLRKLEGEAADLRLRPATELQTRAEAAATRAGTAELKGDTVAQEAETLQAAVLGVQSAAETSKLQAAEFLAAAAQESGAEQELLLAKADAATAASEKLRLEAERLQREGLPAATGGAAGGEGEQAAGPLDRIRDLLRHESSGRTSGLLGLLGGGLRFGVAGFAFTAAFESLRELQGLLRAEGDEAFTTEGKIRNLGAELIGGNLIGGIRALSATKKSEFVGGLAEALKELDVAADDSSISLEKVVSLQRGRGDTRTEEYQAASKALTELGQSADGWVKSQLETIKVEQSASQELKDFLAVQTLQGHISEEQASQILKVAINFDKMQRFAGIAADALDDYTRAVARAGSETAKFGREGGPEGLRGPGRVASQGVAAGQGAPGAVTGQQTTGIPRPIVTNPFPNPTFQAPDQAVGAAAREALAARLQDDQERLAAQLKNLQVTQQQKRTAFEEAKAAKEVAEKAGDASAEARVAAAAYSDLVQATTSVGAKAAELAATTKANVEATQAAASRTRDARAAQITDPDARLQAELGNARIDEQTAAAAAASAARAAEHAKKGSAKAREAAEAQATYEEAVASRAGIEQQIASNQQAAAEAARQDARGAEEARLANNIAAAAQTAGKADDKRYYNEAIAHYQEVAADANETKTAREQARGTVRELRAARKQALQGDVGDPNDLRQQLLQNALARAEQAGDLPATRRAAQKIVDFWQEQVKATTGIERAQAQSNLIGAKGQLQAVDNSEKELAEQKIRNRIAAAQLTKGLGDDKKAADALVNYWEEQFKQAKGLEKARARGNLISAQLARQALDKQADDSGEGGGIGTLDFLGIAAKLQQDFASNLLPVGSFAAKQAFQRGFQQAETPLTPDVNLPPDLEQERADRIRGLGTGTLGDLSLRDLPTAPDTTDLEEQQVDELTKIRQLLERNGTGASVTVNQHHNAPDASGFAQARWARFAMEEAFNG